MSPSQEKTNKRKSSSKTSGSTPVKPSTTTATLSSQSQTPSPHAPPTSFHAIITKIHMHLAPAFVSNPLKGVHEYLSRFLMRHVEELDGVVLSYSPKVTILDQSARVIDDSPFCHFYVKVTFWVFRPKVDAPIIGVVNKVSNDHIGLLVHGIFNASIPSDKIRRNEFRYSEEEEAWKQPQSDNSSSSSVVVLGVGAVVRFTVVELIKANEMLTMVGSLVADPDSTGVIVSDTLPPAPMPAYGEEGEGEMEGEAGEADAMELSEQS
ncbi:hypothetical protein DFJ77DRAFT_552301 [Powellomyces hirtus]|nr:hypothetical protein DFJ77DRAFT_552301 [Powellomyces hirtus]